MNRHAAARLLALISCCFTDIATAATTAFTLETAAPDGFAELTAPQQLVADLYYGNRPLGAAKVTITTEAIRFNSPTSILALLPETLSPDSVLARLSQSLPRNSHRICHSKWQKNCGFLTPDDVSVIYDEQRFRIDLFLSPELLPTRGAVDDPYLPTSSTKVSFIQNLTGNWSGVETDTGASEQTVSLFGRSILAVGESGLHAQWALSENSRSTATAQNRLYQLHWSRDFRGRAYRVGLLQPQGGFSGFSAAPYLYGIEYRSSNSTRTDNTYQQGAPLEVNMPVGGRVEVYKDQRLIHSALLEAGNQLLDTSSFPGGAYDIQIRTLDDSGRPLSEYSQFFAKDSQLPAPGEWRWSMFAGQAAETTAGKALPEGVDGFLAQGSLARRVSDNAGLYTTLTASNEEQLAEIGGRWLTRNLELSPSLLHSSNGRNGYRISASLRMPWFSLNASETHLDHELPNSSETYPLLGQGYRQRSANISAPVFDGQLSLRYSDRGSSGQAIYADYNLAPLESGATKLTTLDYRRNVIQSRDWLGQLSLSHSDADGERVTRVGLQFRFRRGRWHHGTRTLSSSNSAESSAGYDINWNDGDLFASEFSQQLSASYRDDDYSIASNTRLAGRRGRLGSTVQISDTGFSRSVNYLGAFGTNLVSDGKSFAWGGERPYDSGVMVAIDGSPEQNFEVLVDGIRKGYARGGSRSLINLPAFRRYDFTLRPLAEGFHEFQEKQDSVTLYPGNIAEAHYQAETLVLILGRIVNGGNPIVGTRIHIGEHNALTDDYGVFQLEIPTSPGILKVPPVQWAGCEVDISHQTAGEHWVNLGVVDLAHANCDDSAQATNTDHASN